MGEEPLSPLLCAKTWVARHAIENAQSIFLYKVIVTSYSVLFFLPGKKLFAKMLLFMLVSKEIPLRAVKKTKRRAVVACFLRFLSSFSFVQGVGCCGGVSSFLWPPVFFASLFPVPVFCAGRMPWAWRGIFMGVLLGHWKVFGESSACLPEIIRNNFQDDY